MAEPKWLKDMDASEYLKEEAEAETESDAAIGASQNQK